MAEHNGPDDDEREDASFDEEEYRDDRRRVRLDGIVPDVLKRAMLSGLGALFVTEETIRSAVSDMPKDAVRVVMNQADATKDQILGVLAAEIREFLHEIDVGEELSRVLSTMTLEINTQIRMIPDSEDEAEGAELKPDVKTDIKLKRTRKKRK